MAVKSRCIRSGSGTASGSGTVVGKAGDGREVVDSLDIAASETARTVNTDMGVSALLAL
ncbi:hypothetical protein ABZV14_44570 [Streptosporangium canum]|uniref:hypothetical protein n=1 Tax=Streptosporangium canum TaxID=324952 RepID=UPI0033B889E1